MDNSLTSLIDSAKNVLIVLPTKPYFDQVAAGLSLYLSLIERTAVEVFSGTPMSVEFNRLVGINRIKSEIGNKNLVVTFPNYEAGNIEKVSYDIENGQFKLTVVPKVGFSSPTKEQIKTTYSGVSADLVILIGGANDSHFPILGQEELIGAKVAHIGTRALSIDSEKGVMSLAKPASSVSELVAVLIKENGFEMDTDIATNLIMGIEEGSNHFESSEVTPETFEVFAYLLRNGGQRLPKTKLEPRNFPPGSIPNKSFSAPKSVLPEPVLEQVENKEEPIENPPSDWLQPKIYKGTSIS